ncbi:MAG TPA: PQQ-binding-like beta-propeller repeat protein [Chthoniobacteraceae bacterium]|nr:PQQ-binding-like beta-propeller repeat protein [Chthoniobacteraceae bacterium]
MKFPLLFLPVVLTVGSAMGAAFDWPQWRGPNRDDVSKETGLLKKWPAEGPKKLWSFANAGKGYAGYSVVAGKLYTMGTRDGKEVLMALDAATGKELWATPLSDILGNRWGDGPRGTPTVDGDRIYALSGPGTLMCVQAKDGKMIWSKSMKDYGGEVPSWGYTESPLVDGGNVVVTPGGDSGAVLALNKTTGETVWQSKEFTDKAQYASLVPANINGVPQYVQLTMQSVAGIGAKDGKMLWRTDFPGRTAVIPTPIVKGNQVFVTAGYGIGCKSFTVGADNSVTELYRNGNMENHHGGVILIGDYVYGHSKSGWTCLDFKTGEIKWQEKKLGKGAVGYADGMLYLLDEKSGECVLIEASPEGWKENGRFKLDPQTSIRSSQGAIWTHPVISNGRLYLRDQDLIHAYAVK